VLLLRILADSRGIAAVTDFVVIGGASKKMQIIPLQRPELLSRLLRFEAIVSILLQNPSASKTGQPYPTEAVTSMKYAPPG
jgi:hypothetical protein